ncbi:GL18315 [Drosophila persimilis]|uniref:GL18315 n=1 Tax=Drosophila persimilis TaxID=7234 RepID=B4H4S7_DROPE|nr:GL18315 [Drosophila persimilis]
MAQTDFDSDGGCTFDCCAMAKSVAPARNTKGSATAAATATTIHTRRGTTTVTFVLLLVLCCLCDYNYGSWASQCWRKHNSGSIQTADGEFKRPFGILCTYRCFLWFPPM